MKAIRIVSTGDAMFSSQIVGKLVSAWSGDSKGPELSPREQEVLDMVGNGLTNTEIAEHLQISESTVRTYLRRLMKKLDIKNRQQLMTYVLKNQ